MKAIHRFLIFFLLTGTGAVAAPAWRGIVTLTQPDGTEVYARMHGDEFAHWTTDLYGNPLIQDSDGFWRYAVYTADGTAYSSGMTVGKDNPVSSVIPYEAFALKAAGYRRTLAEHNARPTTIKQMSDSSSSGKATESRHCLILLAEFADVKMTYGTQAGFDELINTATGCAKEYFEDQVLGAYTFTFEVGPVVTLSKNQKYYGQNDSDTGNDKNPAEALAEACRLAHEKGIDFSKFDDDGDGYVDNVFLFYAGKDEAEGGGNDCIWAHAWYLSAAGVGTVTLDGKTVDRYAMSSELSRRDDRSFLMTTIGTFCHEYSHVLGLMDMYDTENKTENKPDCLWGSTSLMDGGCYNNEGRTPPYFDAIDRDMLGIGQMETMKEGTYTLEPIGKNGHYLRYDTSNEGEYYLLACRDNSGWDAHIGGKGLLIYHIDKSTNSSGYSDYYGKVVTAGERWYSNEVNCNASHQCADIVEANSSATSVSQIFFPYERNNSFSALSTPAFTFWDGSISPLAITDITSDGDNISFNVVPYGDVTPPKVDETTMEIFQTTAILQWTTDQIITDAVASVTWGKSGKDGTTLEISPYSDGKYALRIDGLQPSTAYTVIIQYKINGIKGKETTVNFTTKSLYTNGYPYIYLSGVERNPDGSFTVGTMIPLVVYNACDAESISWEMDGRSIAAGGNGYYTLTRSCVISAHITYEDGNTDVIEKEIVIK